MIEEPDRDAESYARELVFLQHQLIRLLMLKFDWRPESDGRSLSRLPRYGTLEEPTTIWGFSQHGTGLRFINIRNMACVDIENHLEDSDIFTLWRLQIFVESIGGDDGVVKLLSNAGHEAVGEFATRAENTPHGYRLRGPKLFSPDWSTE